MKTLKQSLAHYENEGAMINSGQASNSQRITFVHEYLKTLNTKLTVIRAKEDGLMKFLQELKITDISV